jgi:hypothetical protein
MTPIPEAFYPRKSSPPDPLASPLPWRTCKRVLGGAVALVLVVCIVQVWRGRNHEYQRMESENKALSLALGTCQGEKERPVSTPAGMTYFGTVPAGADVFVRVVRPAKVASR